MKGIFVISFIFSLAGTIGFYFLCKLLRKDDLPVTVLLIILFSNYAVISYFLYKITNHEDEE